jgi:hypothetical protein
MIGRWPGIKILQTRDLIISLSFLVENVHHALQKFDPLMDMIDGGSHRRTINHTAPLDRCDREVDYAIA